MAAQTFPIERKEIYRILGVLGNLSVLSDRKDQLRQHIGNSTYFDLFKTAMIEEIRNPMFAVYDHLINNNDYKAIQNYFEISLGHSNQELFTVFDPFADNGELLKLFDSCISQDGIGSAQTYLIANGNVSEGFINEKYNKNINDFNNIPKGSVSLMFFNPSCNKLGDTKEALQTIVDRQFLYRSKGDSYYNNNGKIIMIIEKSELLDMLPVLIGNFDIEKELVYRTDNAELSNRFVIYASLRDETREELAEETKEVLEIIGSNPKFSIDKYQVAQKSIPSVPYHELKKNHQIIEKSNFEKSRLDNNNWSWIKRITKIDDAENDKISKPTDLKVGELANVLASGMINGNMQLKDGLGRHVVAGGMKRKEKHEEVVEVSSDGREHLVKKKMIYSEPYLNILVNQDGKAKIKSLYGEMGVETE